MNTQADQFGMKEALAQLGVKDINEGTSTGQQNFSNGTLLESYSPVDGQLIGKVESRTQLFKVLIKVFKAFIVYKVLDSFFL
jgi:aldehyde dehydrogenase (NAD+)